MEHTTIAVDLAKSVFQVAVSHRPGHLDELDGSPVASRASCELTDDARETVEDDCAPVIAPRTKPAANPSPRQANTTACGLLGGRSILREHRLR